MNQKLNSKIRVLFFSFSVCICALVADFSACKHLLQFFGIYTLVSKMKIGYPKKGMIIVHISIVDVINFYYTMPMQSTLTIKHVEPSECRQANGNKMNFKSVILEDYNLKQDKP